MTLHVPHFVLSAHFKRLISGGTQPLVVNTAAAALPDSGAVSGCYLDLGCCGGSIHSATDMSSGPI